MCQRDVFNNVREKCLIDAYHLIDLFECAARRFDAEEIGQGNEGGADNGPDPEVVPSNVVQADLEWMWCQLRVARRK